MLAASIVCQITSAREAKTYGVQIDTGPPFCLLAGWLAAPLPSTPCPLPYSPGRCVSVCDCVCGVRIYTVCTAAYAGSSSSPARRLLIGPDWAGGAHCADRQRALVLFCHTPYPSLCCTFHVFFFFWCLLLFRPPSIRSRPLQFRIRLRTSDIEKISDWTRLGCRSYHWAMEDGPCYIRQTPLHPPFKVRRLVVCTQYTHSAKATPRGPLFSHPERFGSDGGVCLAGREMDKCVCRVG
ncbi:hypothetical protein B0T17DRAFT_265435 [Bombardia bombarda]|uniref:Uncharacterized protein n=1 Tax=Bombardia bombarda TaxID=252184 RepID=A0AA40C4X2_9PEZI|nr:hypothetical protein B0T17DRAFT_265435 [Bombardia bombarda]